MLSYTDREKAEDMPVNPETLGVWYSTESFPVYKDLLYLFFVSGVVDIQQFDRNKCILQYRKYVTVSDKAFTMLTLENNWSTWSGMAKAGK